MKHTSVKLLALVLSLILSLSLAACRKNAQIKTEEASAENYKPAAEAGVTDYGWIPASAFPKHEELDNWYEASKERSSLIYAIYYAKDEATNIWYCWLWAEGYTATDTLALSVDSTNGTDVRIDLTVQNEDLLSAGAHCFAIPGDSEPNFSIFVNEVPEGIIVTLGKSPAIPLM